MSTPEQDRRSTFWMVLGLILIIAVALALTGNWEK